MTRAQAPWPAHGTVDRLFDEARALRDVEERVLTLLHEEGFAEVVVPLLEREGVIALSSSDEDALRFVDRNGDVLGLRADFTGPVARVVASRLWESADVRLSYRGTVFRDVDAQTGARRQQQQAGFEHFGAGGVDEDIAAVARAVHIAAALGLEDLVVSIGSAGVLHALLGDAPPDVRRALDRRDHGALPEALSPLIDLVGEPARAVLDLARAQLPAAAAPPLARLDEIARGLAACGARVVVDLAEVRPWTYYTGFVFSLYAARFPRSVAAGGRYDGLAARFGRARPAVGASFDVEAVASARARPAALSAPRRPLRVALPKGRIQKHALAALGSLAPSAEALASRALLVDGADGRATFVLVKDPDVPAYVERGAADIGIVGKDILEERPADVLQPLVTSWGRCRMCIATRAGVDVAALAKRGTLRVATKYPRIAREALAARGLPAEIVTLQGSVELAVLADLADAIVDLIETGATLRANGLEEKEELFVTTARAIVNRAAWRLRHHEVQAVLSALAAPPADGGGDA